MNVLVCEMCGSNDVIKQDGCYVCQMCGTKYSVEEARKMMIEGTVDVSGSTVRVDNSVELQNLYQLARRAKNDNNSENAQKYYEQIIVKDPSSWEANFYTTYYQSMNCKIGEIGVASTRISNCENTVFNLIKENVADSEERRKAIDEVAAKLIVISNMLFNAYKSHFDGIDARIKGKHIQEYGNNCAAARDIVYNGGNYIVQIFGDEYGDIAAVCWKLGVRQHNTLFPNLLNKKANKNLIKEYNDKIKKYDPSYKAPRTAGCYVATCVYGSYNCPEVWTLRRYRDYTLAATWYGLLFIHIYYAISPTIVKLFGNTKWFKKMWKGTLDRMVAKLRAEGVEDTPYQDKEW
ncbi:MAG: hypothetical protein K2N56_07475 [Oscillospiraceae bacterium]|nr:hypothetical protein [Oscillospiraceae bacterium]